MNYRKFTYIFISILFLFVGYNFVIWNLYTKKLLKSQSDFFTGDLVRIGYITDLTDERKTGVTLKNRHIEASDYDGESSLDMVTIGDSFSNGGGGGENNYYQDFIAEYSNLKILNLMNYQEKTRSYIETAYILANNGFFEKTGVKYVLIESIVRKSVQRFSREKNEKMTDSFENVSKFYEFNKKKHQGSSEINKVLYKPQTPFINNGNVKMLLYNFLYNFKDNAYISDVYRVKLNKDFFSTGEKELLFYNIALSTIPKNTLENINIMNDNLNNLSSFLEKKGIKLIFMPVVNKYDLYWEYFADKSYPEDKFFEIYDSVKKDYIYINTKKLLKKEIDRGIKDVYYVDDSHWTQKASKIISLNLKEQLEKNE